jgi:hypothetical protein
VVGCRCLVAVSAGREERDEAVPTVMQLVVSVVVGCWCLVVALVVLLDRLWLLRSSQQSAG